MRDLLLSASVIDLAALWKIVLAAFVAGVGGVLAVVCVITGMDRFEHTRSGAGADAGGGAVVLARAGSLALAAFGVLVLAAGLVAGFLAMIHK